MPTLPASRRLSPSPSAPTLRSLLPALAGVLLATGPLPAQDAPTPEAACATPSWLAPESLQSMGRTLRLLPSLDDSAPAPSRAWTTARRLGGMPLCGEHPWLAGWSRDEPRGAGAGLLPATVRLTGVSGWPVERGNGLQWAGKGLSGVVRAGWGFRAGRLSVAVRPEVAWAENRPYAVYDTTLADREEYAYPWHARRIDWPQRPGDGSLAWVGTGESRVAVDLGRLEAALSSEQVTWGPALSYPLLLGPSAPGFVHLALSLVDPVRLGSLGTLEGQLMWGALEESDHFDGDGDNDRRLLSGLVLSFQPAVLPGFHLGAASLVHSSWQDLGVGDLLGFVQVPFEGEEGEGNVDGNGLGSLFALWAVPGSGFEAWVEWARDDYSFTVEDLVAEPDHAQAWTAGFQQVARAGSGLVRLAGELTHLGNDEPRVGGRPRNATFYTHATLAQGHTHRGQLLGAPPGPGSDAQSLSLDLLRAGRLWGLRLERIRWDDDAYERAFGDAGYGSEGHDVELTAGLRHARPLGDLRLEVSGDVQLRRNRLFTGLQGVDGGDPELDWRTNLRVEAALTWMPGEDR